MRPPPRRELDGVAHQIVEHLLEVVAIGDHRARRTSRDVSTAMVWFSRRHLQALADLARERGQVHRRQLELELARLDARDVQQLVDEAAQASRL